jgi:8-oxo-dGTP pyrophosphatase MutT (NUDIX family)
MKKIKQYDKKISKFLTISKKVFKNKKKNFIFHNIKTFDYVTILAKTTNSKFPLLFQYRHTFQKYFFELPGGLVDSKKNISKIIKDELYEETGLKSNLKPKLVGKIYPDIGRMENMLWVFYLDKCKRSLKWKNEEKIKTKFLSKKEIFNLIKSNKFNSSVHLSAILLCLLKKYL